jgi:MEMO1 family protein
MAQETIRESVIAGSWYPGNASSLRKDLNRYLEQARPPEIQGDLRALLVPHAGYVYSGGVAAHAYRLLQDRPFDRVMILAPSHRAYFKGASVYTPGGYRTPLGIVPLDREIIDALLNHPSVIRFVPEADAQEHSLEIQLPFLQVVLKEFRLTPIIMGEKSISFCRQLAKVISEASRGLNVLLVASSDLSHFHPSTEAKRLDRVVCDNVAAYDPESLSRRLEQGECEACGAGPMLTVMLAARELGANTAKVLHYADSGDISGDPHSVVGYMAAALSNNS